MPGPKGCEEHVSGWPEIGGNEGCRGPRTESTARGLRGLGGICPISRHIREPDNMHPGRAANPFLRLQDSLKEPDGARLLQILVKRPVSILQTEKRESKGYARK